MTEKTNDSEFIDYLATAHGLLQISASQHGVKQIIFVSDKNKEIKTSSATDTAKKQLEEYFNGERRDFYLPLAPSGTEFQKLVWSELAKIPFGQTQSYQDIANAIGKPKAMRAVGAANGKNPISIIVPCHRVIGKNGTLTGYAGGLERKAWLLKLEGISC